MAKKVAKKVLTREEWIKILKNKILSMIKKRELKELKSVLSILPEYDITDLILSLKPSDAFIVFRLLPKHLIGKVFADLSIDVQKVLLNQMSKSNIQKLLVGMAPDDLTALFEELPGEITQKLLNLLPEKSRKKALRLLGYPENSVGRLMTPNYVALRKGWTIKRALEHIRKFGKGVETIDVVYVVDDKWHLLDDIQLRKLIVAEPKEKVESVMDRRYIAISPYEDQEEAVKLMKKYDLVALPIVDSENVLLGIVTIDDIMDVLEEETTEDIHKGGAIEPLKLSYSATPVFQLYKKRIAWLLLLLIAGFLSSSVIAIFKKTIAAIVALAFFIPVLIGSGGNTGTQSATLIIRSLVTGDLSLKKWFNVVKKEIGVGMLLGVTLGIIISIWSFIWIGNIKISLAIGFSMLAIILWANLVGGILPIILTKLKLDPAVISSPFISTLVDATGLLIYFTVVKIFIGV